MKEILQSGPAEAVASLLDVDLPDLDRDGLPLLWHWFYLLDRPAQADLGPDGHPVRGMEPGRRRMWAGGRVRTLGPLRCGLPAERYTEVLSTQEKQGRTGRLTFVVTGHRIVQGGEIVVEEEQDIVYRDAASGRPEAPVEGPEVPVAENEWAIDVSPTLLFRFSALTYNAHRIHYDRDYARDVEGYPGLLTHGPLQALAMAEAARRRGSGGRLAFDYRLVSPLFDHQGLIVRSDDGVTAVRDRYGRRTATGTVRSLGR